MTATIYQMPSRATVEQKTEERAMSEDTGRDRYDSMTRAELRAECDARGIRWAPIERVALAADRSEYTRRIRGGIGGAALREVLREYDRYNRDITDDIQSVITHLTDLLALPLEDHDLLARPALARKAVELALDLLSDHT